MKRLSIIALILCLVLSCIAAGCTKNPTTTPSATPSVSVSSTPTPSTSVSATPTPSVSVSSTPTPSTSVSATPTPSVSVSSTPTPSVSVSATPTPSVSVSATPTPSVSVSATPTPSVSVSATPTPSVSVSSTPTPSVSVSATPTPSVGPSVPPSVEPEIIVPSSVNKVINGDFPAGTTLKEDGNNFDADGDVAQGILWGWHNDYYTLSEEYNRYIGDGTYALVYNRPAGGENNSWFALKMAVEGGKTYVFSFDMMCINAIKATAPVIRLAFLNELNNPNDSAFAPLKDFAQGFAWGTSPYKTYSFEFTAEETGYYYFDIVLYGMSGTIAFDEFKCYEKGQTLPDKSLTYEENEGVAVSSIVNGDCPASAPLNDWGWITDDDNSVAPGTFWGYNTKFFAFDATYNRYIGDGTSALVFDSSRDSIAPNAWVGLKIAVEQGKTYVFSFDMMSINATKLNGHNVHLSLVTECKENGATTVVKDFADVITWGTQPYGTYSTEFTATKTGYYYFRIMLYAFSGLVAFDEFTCYEKGADIPVKDFPKYEGATTVSLSFTGGEGTTGSVNPIIVNIGETVTLPANGFTKANSEFLGWTVNGTEYSVGDTLILTQNLVATARWKTWAVGTNLVSNGTFNTNGTGFPAGWWGYNHQGASNVSVTNGALKIVTNDNNIVTSIPVTLQKGVVYTLSADMTVNKMQTGTAGGAYVGFAVSKASNESAVKPENAIASLFYTASISVTNDSDFKATTGYAPATFTVDEDGEYYVVFASWAFTIDLTIDNVSVVGAMPTQEPAKERIRILISSDMHYTPDSHSWYGVGSNARLQQWVDGIKAEHQKDPIDALVILGDESLDHWAFPPYGYYLTTGTSYTKLFVDNYVSQLPKDFPIYYVPGNHEQYGNAKWFEITGQNRQGHFTVGDNLFVLSDTYGGNLDPTEHHDGVYTGVDMNHLMGAVKANANVSNIWLLAHEYALNAESTQFRNFLNSNKRVRGLFMGHTHHAAVLATNYRGLTIAQTGNFSYTLDNATESAWKQSFWGYRELVIETHSAVSNYIIPASSGAYTEGGSATTIPYQKVHQATYSF